MLQEIEFADDGFGKVFLYLNDDFHYRIMIVSIVNRVKDQDRIF